MRKADNLPLSCAVVTKSWSLNFLEPSGPVQACNGTALPLLQLAGHVECGESRDTSKVGTICNEAVVVVVCFNISPLFLKEFLKLLVCCAASMSSSLPTSRDTIAVLYIKAQHIQIRFSILLGSVEPSI